MTLDELLAELEKRAIQLGHSEGRLQLKSPAGAIDAELHATLAYHKPALIALLQGGGFAAVARSDGRTALTANQQGMLLQHRLAPHGSAYHMPLVLRWEGELHGAVLREAVGDLVRRHPSLHSRYAQQDGVFFQQAVNGHAVAVPVRACTPESLELAVQACIAEPFELAGADVFHATLLQVAPQLHYLVCVAHHIAADGWSGEILKADLSALYRARRRGKLAPAAPSLSFADFSHQLGARHAAMDAADSAFWRDQLADFGPVSDLALLPDALQADPCCEFVIDGALAASLTQFVRRHGLTLYPVLLAAFAVVLTRLSGQTQVVVSCPQANRTLPGSAEVVGLFLDSIPIRARPLDGSSFLTQCRALDQVLRQAGAHTSLALTDILALSGVAAGTGIHPLQQAALNLLDFPRQELAFEGARVTPLDVLPQEAKYAINLYVLPEGGRWRLRYHARAERFSVAGLAVVQQQLVQLLGACLAEPDTRPAAVALCGADAPEALATLPPAALIPSLFRQQAARTAQALAVQWDGASYTYAELAEAVDAVHAGLLAAGLAPGDRVGIAANRNASLVVAMMACLQAGCSYVIVDQEALGGRLRALLPGLDLRLWLDTDSVAELAPQVPRRAVQDLVDTYAGQHPHYYEPHPEAEACLTFTSGSTGLPRAVQGRHAALGCHLAALAAGRAIASSDRFAMLGGLMSDPLQRDLFTPLCLGASVAIPAAHDMQPHTLASWVGRVAASILNLTPPLARYLVSPLDPAPPNARLRWLFLCGDLLRWQDVHALRALAPRVGIVNLYGMTESQRALSEWLCVAEGAVLVAPLSGSVPIGATGIGTRLHVQNDGLAAGWGEAGELYLEAAQAARAYLDAPADSAMRFVPAAHGRRWIRTSDRARPLPDGSLEFLGRAGDQINLRGHRFSLREIDMEAAAVPGVAEACSVAEADPDGELLVTLYWSGSDPAGAQLAAALRRVLPAVMVPARLVRVTALPLNRAGKIDLAQLRREAGMAPQAADVAAPVAGDSLAEAAAALWGECLGQSGPVGPDADFFALGGHSLRALQLCERLQQAFGVRYPIERLFEQPGLAACVTFLRQHCAGPAPPSWSEPEVVASAPAAAAEAEPFPLTDVQQAYWMGRSAAFVLGGYSTSTYVEFAVDEAVPERMQAALQKMLERHPMLRCVVSEDGLQRILPAGMTLALPCQDLRALDEPSRAGALRQWRSEMEQHVFDTGRWPLFDVRLSLTGEGRGVAHVAVDLLIADYWSSRIIMQEFLHYYRQPQCELPSSGFAFSRYVAHLRERKLSARYVAARDYWLGRADSIPAGPLLPQRSGPAPAGAGFTRRDLELSPERWLRLGQRARAINVTRSVVLMTAYAQVLARWSEQARLCLNLTLFDRPPIDPDIMRTVGEFTSLTLLEMDAGSGTFSDQARRTQRRLFADLEHASFSAIELMRELGRRFDDGRARMAPVVFTDTLDHDQQRMEGQSDAGWEEQYRNAKTSQVWIDHTTSRRGDRLLLHWNTLDHVFPEGMVEQMFACYGDLIERLCDDADAWDSASPPALPAPQQQRRRDYQAAMGPAPDGLLHTGFLERLAETPQAVALLAHDVRLSYSALGTLSADLAHALTERGVARGETVAVLLPKGWQQVPAVLAVLLAGANYLPLDPAWPTLRLQQLLQDCQVRQVITSAELRATSPYLAAYRCSEVGAVASAPARWRARAADPDDAAYVIFTSGSTGQPKGVVMTHRAVLNTMQAMNSLFEVTPQDRLFAISGLSFDLSVYDIFGGLAAGAALVVPDAAQLARPACWLELVREYGVTLWNSVPALLQVLIEGLEGQEGGLEQLRLILLSGDWIALSLLPRISRHAPQARLISLGGATEAAVWSIYYPVHARDPEWNSVPYGIPLPKQSIHVLRDDGLDCAEHAVGEIHIGGAGLAREYLGDPVRTRASLVVHGTTGERLYKTGDLGRFLPQGYVELIGRRDNQVKLAGHRIELGEIEAQLERLEGIAEAAVVVRTSAAGARYLAAFMVGAASGGAVAPAAPAWPVMEEAQEHHWRAKLAKHLPTAMLPRDFVWLSHMPLSANGKLDRQKLAMVPLSKGRTGRMQATTTLNGYSARLAPIWTEVLALTGPPVLDDSFFQLGGNSLLALRCLNRINVEFGVALSVGDVYANGSLGELAAVLERHMLAGQVSAARPALDLVEEGEI